MSTIDDVLRGEARWCVVHGDCREVLPTIPSKSVGVCLTDPPYSARVHAGVRSAKRHEAPDVAEFSCRTGRVVDLGFEHLSSSLRRAVSGELSRIVERWSAIFSDEDSMHLWRTSLGAAGLPHIRSMFWIRRGAAPQFTGDRPAVGVEAITLAHPPGRKRWNGGGKAAIYDFPIVANRNGHRSDRVHTTQKPLELMMALVKDFTEPGEVVLDPFAGSGTTGSAALRLGCRVILIEQDAGHARTCRERMEADDDGSTLQAKRAGQGALFR